MKIIILIIASIRIFLFLLIKNFAQFTNSLKILYFNTGGNLKIYKFQFSYSILDLKNKSLIMEFKKLNSFPIRKLDFKLILSQLILELSSIFNNPEVKYPLIITIFEVNYVTGLVNAVSSPLFINFNAKNKLIKSQLYDEIKLADLNYFNKVSNKNTI